MKSIFFFICSITFLNCQPTSTAGIHDNTSTGSVSSVASDILIDSIPIQNLFTLPDAVRILGEPARTTDSTLTQNDDAVVFKSTYTADSPDAQTGKTGNLYIMMEDYKLITVAAAVYASIKKANENHEGIRVLHNLGDEAYFHSDGENFLFILARKNGIVLRMKVNKMTGNTRVEEFEKVAGEVMERI